MWCNYTPIILSISFYKSICIWCNATSINHFYSFYISIGIRCSVTPGVDPVVVASTVLVVVGAVSSLDHAVFQVVLPEHGVGYLNCVGVVGAVSSLNHAVFQAVLPEHGVGPAVLVIATVLG